MEDYELLRMIKEGNSDAYNELIIKYRSSVEAIAMKYIAYPIEKEDLVQEGMIGLLAAIRSYNSEKGTKFSTYASRCVDNSIKSAIKKISRMKDIPANNQIALEEEIYDSQYGLSAEDEYLAKESVFALKDILYEGLSCFENEVLGLHVMGYSYNEIADKLGKNTKAIDNAIQRIRKKLTGVAF